MPASAIIAPYFAAIRCRYFFIWGSRLALISTFHYWCFPDIFITAHAIISIDIADIAIISFIDYQIATLIFEFSFSSFSFSFLSIIFIFFFGFQLSVFIFIFFRFILFSPIYSTLPSFLRDFLRRFSSASAFFHWYFAFRFLSMFHASLLLIAAGYFIAEFHAAFISFRWPATDAITLASPLILAYCFRAFSFSCRHAIFAESAIIALRII